MALLDELEVLQFLPEDLAAVLEQEEDVVERVEFIEEVAFGVVRSRLSVGDELEAVLDAA